MAVTAAQASHAPAGRHRRSARLGITASLRLISWAGATCDPSWLGPARRGSRLPPALRASQRARPVVPPLATFPAVAFSRASGQNQANIFLGRPPRQATAQRSPLSALRSPLSALPLSRSPALPLSALPLSRSRCAAHPAT